MNTNNTEIFRRLNHPYYIWAPPYTAASSGIRVLHYLCNYLNAVGEEAYLITDSESSTNPNLFTPILSKHRYETHKSIGREPIVIYPEIVPGNPYNGRMVVRLLLNVPGLLTKGVVDTFGKDDIIYYHDPEFLVSGLTGEQLTTPCTDIGVYNNFNNHRDNNRSGILYYANRYLGLNLPIAPFLKDAIEISPRHPIAYEFLPQLYRCCERLYTYERSAATLEATLCGCLVVYLENPFMTQLPGKALGGDMGCAWGMDEAEIERARRTLPLAWAYYSQQCEDFKWQLERFITLTQWQARRTCNP